MVSFTSILTALGVVSSLVHGQQFKIQNWSNGASTTNYNYTSLAAGRFTLDWVLGAGGNFVSGKGYSGSKNLWVQARDYLLFNWPISPVSLTIPPNIIRLVTRTWHYMASPEIRPSNSTLWIALPHTTLQTTLHSPFTATPQATALSTSCGPSIMAISASTSLSGGQIAVVVPSLLITMSRLGLLLACHWALLAIRSSWLRASKGLAMRILLLAFDLLGRLWKLQRQRHALQSARLRRQLGRSVSEGQGVMVWRGLRRSRRRRLTSLTIADKWINIVVLMLDKIQ